MWFRESPAEVTRLGNWFDYLTIAGSSLSVFSSDGHFRSFLLLAATVGTLSSLRAPHWKPTDIARHAFLWAIALTLIQTVIFSCFAIGIAMSLLNLEDLPPDDREFYTGVHLVSLPLVGECL